MSTLSRLVIGPEIITQRIAQQEANNLWNYVTAINAALKGNPINADDSITITFYFVIAQDMVDQIVDTYTGVGWTVDVGVSAQAYKSYAGTSVFEFRPTAEIK